jgi:hypothetical protein
MYLYAKEPLGQNRTSLQPCNLARGSSYAFGLAASGLEGFGQDPSRQKHNPQELHERYQRELRAAIEKSPVMMAIRRLPEGQVCPVPERMAAFEQRIREQLWGSFSYLDIERGIDLWRMSMGYPSNLQQRQIPINTGPSMRKITPGEIKRSVIFTAQILEQKFLIAERSGDAKGMTKAAEEYYELLNRYPPQGPGEPMPGRVDLEKRREQLRETRENLLRQAPTLASIVRNLGPWEQAVARGRIAEYVRQRVLARQHRSRARR